MNRIFADTSFYVALLSPGDAHHSAAQALAARPKLRVVTTEFVLVELSNFYTDASRRARLPRLIDALSASGTTRIVPASHKLFRDGLALFRGRQDKEWSLTDCTSFSVMKRLRISEALTADHHFEQAGFSALLR